MGVYEGMFILNPELQGETLEKETDFIKNEIVKQLGEIAEAKLLGKRKLAYPIKKMADGTYFLVNFSAKTEAIKNLNGRLRLNQNILRSGIFCKDQKTVLNEIRD